MLLTMKTLRLYFKRNYETSWYGSACDNDQIFCCERLTGYPFAPDKNTLYITDCVENAAAQDHSYQGKLLCVGMNEKERADIRHCWNGSILFVRADQIDSIIREVRRLCETENLKSRLSMLLMEVLTEDKGIQELTEAAYSFLKNPLAVFNNTYRIAGMTREILHARKSGDTGPLLENGGFSADDYSYVNRDEHYRTMKKSNEPILVFNERLQINQLLISIHKDKDSGYIVVNEVEHPFSATDAELLKVFRNYAYLQIRQEELQGHRGYQISEQFILDLLNETIVITDAYLAFIQSRMNRSFPKHMRCILVATEMTPGAVNILSIQNRIHDLFPGSKTIYYENRIVGIIPVPNSGKISETITDKFKGFCEKNNLYASVSNSFDEITDLRLFYEQAIHALNAGRMIRDEPGLSFYEDNYLVHLKNMFIQKESLEVFLNPALKLLLAYDCKHHTELARTLFMYLVNDRNLVQTAKEMNMHRSSLLYRFEKIRKLLGDIPESVSQRQYYILSYMFYIDDFPALVSD